MMKSTPYMTLAADMATIRHFKVVELVTQISISMGFHLLIAKVNDKQHRIVNRDGKVVSKWENYK